MRGVLKDKTILLVTHQVDFLHNVDLILVSPPFFFPFYFTFVCDSVLLFFYSSYTHTYMCFYVYFKYFYLLIMPGHERGDDSAVRKVQ